MTWFVPLMLLAAAFLEVGGDAVIGLGLRGSRPALVVCGMVLLAFWACTWQSSLPLHLARPRAHRLWRRCDPGRPALTLVSS